MIMNVHMGNLGSKVKALKGLGSGVKKIAFSRSFIWLAAGFLLVVPGPVPAAEVKKLDEVSVKFRWFHQFQFAGFYAAEEKGYYREAGLKVELKELSAFMKDGGISEVLSGDANYGVTFSSVVSSRLWGNPVVVLAAIFQHSPTAIFARIDSGVSNIHDVLRANATLGNFTENPEFVGMFFNEGIPFEKVLETLPIQNAVVTRDAIYEFDVIPGYLTDQPYFLQKHNIPYLVFQPSTYGYDFYGDCLYTSEKELSNHPERTARFLQASLEGVGVCYA